MKNRGVCVWGVTLGLALSSMAVAAGSLDAAAPPADSAADASSLASGDVVDGEYIVRLEPSSGTSSWLESYNANDLHARVEAVMAALNAGSTGTQDTDGQVIGELRVIDGFGARLSPESAERLAGLPGVVSVTPNKAMTLDDDQLPTRAGDATAGAVQKNPTWGLDRIDQESLPLDNLFAPANEGDGVHIYIIDSGIYGAHVEFDRGLGDGPLYETPEDNPSCFKHGTHIAGTAGGSTVGVAKKATLHPVRIFDCDGKTSTFAIVQGIDWVAGNAKRPAVANMSFGGPTDVPINIAVDNLAELGVVPVVEAGNTKGDACSSSPASATSAITVAASDEADAYALFTNLGECVDVFAPGTNVLSAATGSPTDFVAANGTSVSAPHVAGVVATYLHDYPDATAQQVKGAIIAGAAAKVTGVPVSTTNKLVNAQALPVPATEGQIYPLPKIAPFDPEFDFGSTTVFDASGSKDPGGAVLQYAWRIDDSPTTVATGPKFTHVNDVAGWHTVHLTIANARKKATTYAKFFVGDSPDSVAPIVDFTPGVDQRIKVGQKLYFDGSASNDPDGGDVTYEWRSTGVPDVASRRSTYARTFDQPGHIDVELTVIDDEGVSSTKKIDVFVTAPPIASFLPGQDIFIVEGEYIIFNGTYSKDPDGGELKYEWRTTGLGVVSNEDTYGRSFDDLGRTGVQLIVTDDEGESASQHIDVWVRAAVPPVIVFDPEDDQHISVGQTINFSGEGSYDPDGGELFWEWTVNGSGIVERIPRYSRTFTEPGTYDVTLTVIDDEAVSASKTVTVLVSEPAPPIVNITPDTDQETTVGKSITFDGSASNDPDGGWLNYQWSSPAAPGDVSTEETYSPTFTEAGESYVQLTVTDDEGVKVTKQVRVSVNALAAPIAEFTPGETRRVSLGQSFTFDGSASNDPDGGELDFVWRTTGLGIVSRDKTYSRKFDTLGRVGVELTVTDDEGVQAVKHVNFWVTEPAPPIASFTPGVDQFVKVGESLTFDGSASNDPDGGKLDFVWRTTGLGIVSRDKTYTRSFDTPGRAGIELTVTDDEGQQTKKHINVWVSS